MTSVHLCCLLAGQKAVEDEAESSDEDDDGYGDDLYGDDEDRARLAAMNEMEREMELFERSEARDRRREARRNKRLLKQSQRKEQARLPRTLLLPPLSCTVMVAAASPLLLSDSSVSLTLAQSMCQRVSAHSQYCKYTGVLDLLDLLGVAGFVLEGKVPLPVPCCCHAGGRHHALVYARQGAGHRQEERARRAGG